MKSGNDALKIGIMVLFAAGLLVACSRSKSSQEPDELVLQLNWTHEVEFAGYYTAREKGFYGDENIAVTIHEGGIGVLNVKAVADKSADFEVVSMASLKRGIALGEAGLAVAAICQISPSVLFSLAESGIECLKDVAGRRVAIKNDRWRDIALETLANAGVDSASIIEIDTRLDDMEMLYNGEVDIWTGYVHDEPTEAILAGKEINLFFTSDYAVGSYEGLLIVHYDTIDKNPELVNRFMRASLKGWQYTIEHPDEVADIVARFQPDRSLRFHQIALRSLLPLIFPPMDLGRVPLGWIDAARWKTAMGEAITSDQPGYTMQFLKAMQD